MIWVADRLGKVTFLSPEWPTITGKPREEAFGEGWIASIHESDAGIVISIYEAAVRARSGFVLQYRLRFAGGNFAWVISGAVPSINPEGEFIGSLGSVTKIEQHSLVCLQAGGRLGKFDPPVPHALTLTQEALGLAADHLLIAHAFVIDHPAGRNAVPHIETAMREIAAELAHSIESPVVLN